MLCCTVQISNSEQPLSMLVADGSSSTVLSSCEEVDYVLFSVSHSSSLG